MKQIIVFLAFLFLFDNLKAWNELAETPIDCEQKVIASCGKGLNWLTWQYDLYYKKGKALHLCLMNYVALHPEDSEKLKNHEYSMDIRTLLRYYSSSPVILKFSIPEYHYFNNLEAETVSCHCHVYDNRIDPNNRVLIKNDTFTFFKTKLEENYFHVELEKVNQRWHGHIKSCYKFTKQERKYWLNWKMVLTDSSNDN